MKRNVILIGFLVLGLLFLAGCGRKPGEVELGEKELILREETPLPEETALPEKTVELPPPVAPTVPPVEEKVAAPSPPPEVLAKPTLKQVDTDGDGIPDTWVMVGPKSTPTAAPRATTPAAKAKEKGKLNINTATAEEIDNLPGLGPTRVERLIAGRPYAKIEDIRKIPGIGSTTYDRIKDLITVD